VILQRQDRLAEAERMALRLLELEPDHAEARNNLGVIYARQGRTADAAEQFARAVELNPDYTDAQDNLARARELLEQEQ